jgi:hypothetical protein
MAEQKERPEHLSDLDLKGGVGRNDPAPVAPKVAAARFDPSPEKHVDPEELAQHQAPRTAKAKGRTPLELHALASAGEHLVVTDAEMKACQDWIAARPEGGDPDPDGVAKADLKHFLRRLDISAEGR